MYRSVVFQWQGKYNLLITESQISGRSTTIAHFILPEDWTEDDVWEYGGSVIESAQRGLIPLEHRTLSPIPFRFENQYV